MVKGSFQRLAMVLAIFWGIAAAPSHASLIFDFTYSLPPSGANGFSVTASGTIMTTDYDPVSQGYDVTGISGTRIANGIPSNITGLLADPTSYGITVYGQENVLYPSDPFISYDGLFFFIDTPGLGTSVVNVYWDGAGYTEPISNVGDGTFSAVVQFNPQDTGTPEPDTLFMLAGGLALVCFRKLAPESLRSPRHWCRR